MQPPYLTLDMAYYSPAVFAAADWINQQQTAAGRPERVQVIFFYVFDPHVVDVNRYCGGWTPEVVAQIADRGYIPGPIVCMRPAVAGGMLTPDEIKLALTKYPALTQHPVHIKVAEDQETGSFTGAAWSQALAAAMPTELYGSAATVLSDYAAGVAAIWVGNYPGIPVVPPPDLSHIPGVPDDAWPDARAWQYVGSAQIAGTEVDVSISNVPLGGDPMANLILTEDEQREMLNRARNVDTKTDWINVATDLVKTHLPAIEASQAAIQKAIKDAGGHPADAPILAEVAKAQASITAVQTAVAAIKAKTDKDLA